MQVSSSLEYENPIKEFPLGPARHQTSSTRKHKGPDQYSLKALECFCLGLLGDYLSCPCLKFDDYFYLFILFYEYGYFVCVHECVLYAPLDPKTRPFRSPEPAVVNGCKQPCQCWDSNPYLLQEQQML